MTPDSVGPFSRPLPLHRVTSAGLEIEVEADEAERGALAADLDLPAIHRLSGRYRVTSTSDRIRVVGRVEASVDQVCVVTLDPFTAAVDEDVEVEFAPAPDRHGAARDAPIDLDLADDPPDELAGDAVDLGAITAEFLALGLDPYPKKPGARFEQGEPEGATERPFDKLASLRPPDGTRGGSGAA